MSELELEQRTLNFSLNLARAEANNNGRAVFSVGAAPRLHNKDLTKLELESRESPELAVAAEN
jgi:hypothetical protein